MHQKLWTGVGPPPLLWKMSTKAAFFTDGIPYQGSARPANWVWENIELQFWPKLIIEPFLQCGFKGLHVGPKVPPMLSACAML